VEQAIQVISQTRKASATLLQRKLNIGFARAARVMDILEEKGLIGPQDGAKPRDIFI
jgi:S-DNA-T family DNA segregation ATPase FtsK/SpoIIIE